MKILLKGLLKDIHPVITDWDEPSVRTNENGEEVIGRPSIGYGDSNEFTYAGKTLKARSWTDEMNLIKDICQQALEEKTKTDKKITFLLAGYYPEYKGIPMHSDAVPSLNDWVVSCSFGGTRVFAWREYEENIKSESYTSKANLTQYHPSIGESLPLGYKEDLFLLEHGDVLIFNGKSQMDSQHSVPDLIGTKPRINLTFRTGL